MYVFQNNERRIFKTKKIMEDTIMACGSKKGGKKGSKKSKGSK